MAKLFAGQYQREIARRPPLEVIVAQTTLGASSTKFVVQLALHIIHS